MLETTFTPVMVTLAHLHLALVEGLGAKAEGVHPPQQPPDCWLSPDPLHTEQYKMSAEPSPFESAHGTVIAGSVAWYAPFTSPQQSPSSNAGLRGTTSWLQLLPVWGSTPTPRPTMMPMS